MPKVLRRRRRVQPLRFGRRLITEVGRNNLFGVAAQLAYNFLFSLFPFLIFLVALAAFLPVKGIVDRLLGSVRPFVPTSAFDLVARNLRAVVTHRHGELLAIGLLTAIWSASNAISSLMTGLNLAYAVQETRPFWKTRGIALAVTIGGAVAGLLGISVAILGGDAGRWLSGQIGAPNLYNDAWAFLRWPILALLLMIVLAFLYWICPNVKMRFRLVTPGSLLSTVLWLAASVGFSFYTDHFGNYNAMYGSLGAVIVLLTWFYITGLILVLGGQVNALLALLDREDAALAPSTALGDLGPPTTPTRARRGPPPRRDPQAR